MKNEPYDALEQSVVLSVFGRMLRAATRDGGKKRALGLKPPWWQDDSHEAAVFSHLESRRRGNLCDEDSGVHPYIHLAWRALAIAYQETYGRTDPLTRDLASYEEVPPEPGDEASDSPPPERAHPPA
jgi:hypothetical protein